MGKGGKNGPLTTGELDNLQCSVVLNALVTRTETDTTEQFLLSPADHQLGAVAFTSTTDFHVTGADTSVFKKVLGPNQELSLAIPNATLRVTNEKTGAVEIEVPEDTRVNVTCSQHALGIDGTLSQSMSGQCSVLLKDILDDCSGGGSFTTAASYCGWKANAATLTSSAASLGTSPCMHRKFGKKLGDVKLNFKKDEEKQETIERAYKMLEALYEDASKVRENDIVFAPAKNLTKPVMSVPFGINGSGFDLSAAVCDRPLGFSDEAIESMLMGGLKSACGFEHKKSEDGTSSPCDGDIIEAFKSETSMPSISGASRWAVVAGDVLSAANAVLMPYRVDGRAVLLPTGADLQQAESWYAEAIRSSLHTGDCEDSGSSIVVIAKRCGEVARDKELSETFPVMRGIGNALAHHVVGLSVMAANAGNADAAGEGGASAIAGHAACLAIPKTKFALAMRGGFECRHKKAGKNQKAVDIATRKLMSMIWNSLYGDERGSLNGEEMQLAMSSEENVYDKLGKMEDLATGKNVTPVFDHVASSPLSALGIEGTAPVSPTILYSQKEDDRIERQRLTAADIAISGALQQNVARSISVIDVDTSNYNKNKFYSEIVEFIVPTSSHLCKDAKLREFGVASPHFVFSKPACDTQAGCSPMEIGVGDFYLSNLYSFNEDSGKLFDVARADVAANTMPKRDTVERLTPKQAENVKTNLESLKNLSTELKMEQSAHTHTAYMLITLASLTARGGLAAFVDSLKQLKGKIGVSVESFPLDGLLHDENGEDVGEFIQVGVTAHVR